jgi:hypothetical protein
MYPLDLLTLPGSWLRRTRLWYARGRTWRPAARRADNPAAGRTAGRVAGDRRTLAARAG